MSNIVPSPCLTTASLRRALLFMVVIGLIVATSCSVVLVRFEAPSEVLPGDLFEVIVTGQGSAPTGSSPSDLAGVVVQIPNNFTLIDAVGAAGETVFTLTVNDPSLLSLYTSEVGHYLVSYTVQTINTTPASLRLRLRAPAATGVHGLKISLAATTGGVWSPNVPAGTTNFAAITASTVSRTISVTTNPQSPPTWQPNIVGLVSASPPTTTFSRPFDVDTADFDGDGRVDLLCGALGSGGVQVPLIQSGRYIEGFVPTFTGGAFRGPTRTGNFNGDAFPDVVANRNVYLGGPGGALTLATTLPIVLPVSTLTTRIAAAVGDINGDGLDDIIRCDGSIEVFRSLGNGTFAPSNVGLPTVATIADCGALEVADLDGDGDRDIVVGGWMTFVNPSLAVYLNDGSGNWTNVGSAGTGLSGTQIAGIGVGDINGDARPDLVISRMDGGIAGAFGAGIAIAYGVSPGVFTSVVPGSIVNIGLYSSFAFDDLDGDGFTDIIAAQETKFPVSATPVFGRIRIFRTLAGGVLAQGGALENGLPADTQHSSGRLLYRDVDGDGRRDIIVASNLGVSVYSRFGPLHSTMRGAVGASVVGGPFSILTVNGSSGDVTTRAVNLGLGQALTITLAQSPTTGLPSRGVIWGRIGQPQAGNATPTSIGLFAFAPHLLTPNDPFSFTLMNSFIATDPLALLPGASPGVFSFSLPTGPPFPLRFALEAMVDDSSSTTSFLSRTNVVHVEVR